MRMLSRSVALVIFVAWVGAAMPQSSQHRARESDGSCPDDEEHDTLHDAPPPPAGVTAAVLGTTEAKDAVDELGVDKASKLLRAQRIYLASGETDYIVLGSGSLSGADNYWFWLVRSSPGPATVYGWFGADCVSTTRRMHERHRDVDAGWASAAVSRTQIFRFRAGKYRLWQEHSEDRRKP